MLTTTTVQQAISALYNNKLRTCITMATITFGLTALIAILTSIEAMKLKLKDSFSFMGANAFKIIATQRKIQIGGRQTTLQSTKSAKPLQVTNITYDEALTFKNEYTNNAQISITSNGQQQVTVSNTRATTPPNVSLISADENYITVNAFALQAGNNLTYTQCIAGNQVCLLGEAVAKKLYGNTYLTALYQTITINGKPFVVQGLLQPKGNTAFESFDNIVITSCKAGALLKAPTKGYSIGVKVANVQNMDAAITDATLLFKSIRKAGIGNQLNFEIEKSDRLANLFITATTSITIAAIAIGLITLLGAAIGLMNIMLVTVNERTKEIGLLKAIGANNAQIKKLFIYEALLLCIAGATLGVILGIIIGNIVGYYLDTPFIFPLNWVILGITICILSGLMASLYPAAKAAKLSPIDALRYE